MVYSGYRLTPGGKWNGEYLVCDLEDFAHRQFHEDADWTILYPHITKQVVLPLDDGVEVVRFPLKAKHERHNRTLEGLEERAAAETEFFLERPVPVGKEPELEPLLKVEPPAESEARGSNDPEPGPNIAGFETVWVVDSNGRRYQHWFDGRRVRKDWVCPPGVDSKWFSTRTLMQKNALRRSMGLPDIPDRRQDVHVNGNPAVCVPISQWNDVGYDAIPAGDEGDAEWDAITQRMQEFQT